MCVHAPVRRSPQLLVLLSAIYFGFFLGNLSLPRVAQAQHRSIRGAGEMPGSHGGFGDHGFRRGNDRPRDTPANPSNTVGTMRGGLQLGPPGRWWDDKHFAKQLHLRPDQQQRMDAIFEQSRTTLLKRYENLQQEELRMVALTHAHTLDENALFTQIDRVEQARADLEKANTHLLFQIRSEMDPDQLANIEEQH